MFDSCVAAAAMELQPVPLRDEVNNWSVIPFGLGQGSHAGSVLLHYQLPPPDVFSDIQVLLPHWHSNM